MMFPSLSCSTTTQRFSQPDRCSPQSESFNCPEENDETVSDNNFPSILSEPTSNRCLDPCSPRRPTPTGSPSGMAAGFPYTDEHTQSLPGSGLYQLSHSQWARYNPATPFPSWEEGCPSTLDKGAWLHPSFASSYSGYPSSLPSCLPSGEYPSFPRAGLYPPRGSHSLPGQCSSSIGSLEQPRSLHSIPPNAVAPHVYYLPPFPCPPQGPTCCSKCPAEVVRLGPPPHHIPRTGYQLPYRPPGQYHCRWPEARSSQSGHPHPCLNKKTAPCSIPLSLEHRKVFVTYEADSDGHVNEIIKFVALLRHNGFDMRIDVFEQQFRSISKIDFMEKFISEKDYLIIIVISPKYYETVTGAHVSVENDERTLNTVYIHKQLQNEFIQNGSRNFRFIPILFPGARKCHVPTWLQNTHIYIWPKDRDDVLRRLMRVEKYNPPPIGELPTIVSIPL
ncbi:hypothetical protein AAFF_G00209050 [Aldrovandia affinis]|uniref:E3 ubiquitin ligase TRAF3IP2 n=1 Tax=Aldrovandia affinis TaxID=143900 RepID=A0AAD7SW22_9TELE|nr:hypothetical protein AAFF_G00209050 [Aldrovandia affinis]